MTAAVDLITTLGVFAFLYLTVSTVTRNRARRPRLCSCGHGSGPHGIDGCVMKQPWTDAASAVNAILRDGMPDRICGCPNYDGQGALVK